MTDREVLQEAYNRWSSWLNMFRSDSKIAKLGLTDGLCRAIWFILRTNQENIYGNRIQEERIKHYLAKFAVGHDGTTDRRYWWPEGRQYYKMRQLTLRDALEEMKFLGIDNV